MDVSHTCSKCVTSWFYPAIAWSFWMQTVVECHGRALPRLLVVWLLDNRAVRMITCPWKLWALIHSKCVLGKDVEHAWPPSHKKAVRSVCPMKCLCFVIVSTPLYTGNKYHSRLPCLHHLVTEEGGVTDGVLSCSGVDSRERSNSWIVTSVVILLLGSMYFKTWTVDPGLYYGLDRGPNLAHAVSTRELVLGGWTTRSHGRLHQRVLGASLAGQEVETN